MGNMIQVIRKTPFISWLYRLTIKPRAWIKYVRIKDLLEPGDKILDIGSGNGGVLDLLINEGYNAEGIDVVDHNFYPGNKVQLYDGKNLPYSSKAYDKSLLLTVLHHTVNPECLVKEALRVSGQLIIIEDVYTSPLNKYLLFFVDSLVNFEFIDHPHSNKTNKEWLDFFKSLNVKVQFIRKDRIMGIFNQYTYLLENI